MSELLIRPAENHDLTRLVELENRCFEQDRLSRRSFRHFLHQGSHCVLVLEYRAQIIAYSLVLMHRGTQLARLYSIAVHPDRRGLGASRRLMEASEKTGAEHGRVYMRLEVRKDNAVAIRLYQSMGYRPFGEYKDYYEDHTDALRLQKRILYPGTLTRLLPIPYYPQQTDYTCGPAALIMAMSSLRPARASDMTEELRIWREATTIYMMSGHGGCSPVGLALAALQRGFQASVWLSTRDTPFVDSVRDVKKKQVIELVHQDYLQQLAQHDVPIHYATITQNDLEQMLAQGHIPLVLISTYRFDYKKEPHWVVVSGMDEHFIYIHDPWIYASDHRFALDNQYLPIKRSSFDRMSQFGQMRLRTAIAISADAGADTDATAQTAV
ncbi:MAG: GNAT family N-acetyltransferase/peptidase C39 family protein [Thiothrix sp.]|nr:GNAT family N-acetyltransferase/peptidase C39 family protein [Thiothrix sp.]HPQ96353.1 GNAT family N-acetyltransferase/peptidase C39 family protein [Thiolinea sp.]